jgi:hypothetical protein
MATQAEIEAATEALHLHLIGGRTLDDCRVYARAVLEAAEQVRPRRDLTAAARMRQSRAKRRAERAVTRAVTPAAGPERAVTGEETRAVTPDRQNSPRPAPILSSPSATRELLARLIDAADGNVAAEAVDVAPIRVLLAAGCDLDLDVLPAVRDIASGPGPIKRWDHPPLIRAVLRGRDVRITPKAPPAPIAATARQPSPGGFDMDELVAGYRVQVKRFGRRLDLCLGRHRCSPLVTW